jgi:hypothetical protein
VPVGIGAAGIQYLYDNPDVMRKAINPENTPMIAAGGQIAMRKVGLAHLADGGTPSAPSAQLEPNTPTGPNQPYSPENNPTGYGAPTFSNAPNWSNDTQNNPVAAITQLYQQDLGRAPDQSGLDFWVNAANSGQSISDINQAFLNSPEYQALHANAAQPTNQSSAFVPTTQPWSSEDNPTGYVAPTFNTNSEIADYYDRFLGRAPDQPGLDYWTNAAKSGQSIEDIGKQIANSQEGKTYGLNQLYQKDFGRAADTEGFNFWQNAMNNGMSLADIDKQFRASDEYRNLPKPTFVDPPRPYVNPFLDGTGTPSDEYRNLPKPTFVDPPRPYVNPFLDGTGTPSDFFGHNDPRPYVNPFLDGTGTPSDFFGHRTEEERMTPPKWYTDQFADTGLKGLGQFADTGLKGLGQFYQGIIPQDATDPVMDFVKNLNQQPQYLQNAFQQQLARLGDPVAAARALLGSLT